MTRHNSREFVSLSLLISSCRDEIESCCRDEIESCHRARAPRAKLDLISKYVDPYTPQKYQVGLLDVLCALDGKSWGRRLASLDINSPLPRNRRISSWLQERRWPPPLPQQQQLSQLGPWSWCTRRKTVYADWGWKLSAVHWTDTDDEDDELSVFG